MRTLFSPPMNINTISPCKDILEFNSYLLYDIVAEIGFISSLYTVSEGEDSAIFFIQNHNPNMETDVVVVFTTTDGTATGNGNQSLPLS